MRTFSQSFTPVAPTEGTRRAKPAAPREAAVGQSVHAMPFDLMAQPQLPWAGLVAAVPLIPALPIEWRMWIPPRFASVTPASTSALAVGSVVAGIGVGALTAAATALFIELAVEEKILVGDRQLPASALPRHAGEHAPEPADPMRTDSDKPASPPPGEAGERPPELAGPRRVDRELPASPTPGQSTEEASDRPAEARTSEGFASLAFWLQGAVVTVNGPATMTSVVYVVVNTWNQEQLVKPGAPTDYQEQHDYSGDSDEAPRAAQHWLSRLETFYGE